ncbi:MAG: DUF6249 domain-containing protein [Mucilaginibacter sp.]|uniref:DUF6249 domain-containing protein n=1 Tax=Mucilaginibacter sp. TaxID=1882438 RepID=UPI0032674888
MDTGNLGILCAIILGLGFFALVFSIFYLYKRETMAMIERGMDPRLGRPAKSPFRYLKWALLLIGSGFGLFLANVLDQTLLSGLNKGDNPATYFSLIMLFGGLGLFVSYLIEKKNTID